MNNHRGSVQDQEILAKAKAFFGEDFGNRREPRLMAYLDYCVKNGGTFNLRQLSPDEVDLMGNWVMKGWIQTPDVCKVIVVSKEFFMLMSEILWDAYAEKDR